MRKIFWHICKRDLLIYVNSKQDCIALLLFFVITVSLFPIAIGPWPSEFMWLVPAIIWIAALLAGVLAQENLLRNDYKLGIFEQVQIGNNPLYWIVLAKATAHWLVFGLPLVLMTPILGLTFNLSAIVLATLTLSLFLGTLILSLLGTIAAALTLTMQRGGVMLAVLLLPLYVPVLILGVNTGILSIQNMPVLGNFALLLSLAIVALLFAPLAGAGAIRASYT